MCLRISIGSKFICDDDDTISLNGSITNYDIHCIQESEFGMFSDGVPAISYYSQHGPMHFLDALSFPLCANIEIHSMEPKKLLGKHKIKSYKRIISNDEKVFGMRNLFIETFGNNIDFQTGLNTCTFVREHEKVVCRFYDLKIFF